MIPWVNRKSYCTERRMEIAVSTGSLGTQIREFRGIVHTALQMNDTLEGSWCSGPRILTPTEWELSKPREWGRKHHESEELQAFRIRLQSERKGEQTLGSVSGWQADQWYPCTPLWDVWTFLLKVVKEPLKGLHKEEKHSQVTRRGVWRVDWRDRYQAPRDDKGLANAAEVWP